MLASCRLLRMKAPSACIWASHGSFISPLRGEPEAEPGRASAVSARPGSVLRQPLLVRRGRLARARRARGAGLGGAGLGGAGLGGAALRGAALGGAALGGAALGRRGLRCGRAVLRLSLGWRGRLLIDDQLPDLREGRLTSTVGSGRRLARLGPRAGK